MASSSTEGGVSEDVTKLMGMGKRHLLCNEVVQAVKCFEEATQTLDNKYGSGSDECGEAYLFYGKALLELARAENGVLGNALKDAEPKSEESSDEDEEKMEAGMETEEKKESDKEQNTEKDKSNETSKDDGKPGQSEESETKEEVDEEMKEGKDNESNKENEDKGEGQGEEEGEEGNEEEGEEESENAEGGGDAATADTAEGQEDDADVPTMQLAWEFLELARLVFIRNDDRESQLNLAEVHLKLGEIQLEQEQFVDAETDYLKCLELQEKHLEPDDRLIAETYPDPATLN
ncbi:Protein HGV2 [Acropora cervicornis]|uniref:Protein HGV2 n=1 Tax=Acropora cervicornis TaxID=6130 RepID=A0AAD9QYJ1_ACRCE|nr:Protein HGV2 [Acropora cervicornis]